MKVMLYGGYLFTDKYFLQATRDHRLSGRWALFSAPSLADDNDLIELQRVCLVDDPYTPADRFVAFLPKVEQLPAELQRLDVTDLIFVEYEYFRLVTDESYARKLTLRFYLNLVLGCMLVWHHDRIIGGIPAVESVRLQELLHSRLSKSL